MSTTEPRLFRVEEDPHYPVGESILHALDMYLNKGILPGHFLTSCLENNLKNAFGYADDYNTRNMRNIVGYLYNRIPSNAWGSRDEVMAWCTRVQEKRRGMITRYYQQDGCDFYSFESQEAYDNPETVIEPAIMCTYPNTDPLLAESMELGTAAEKWFLEIWCPEHKITPIKINQ